MENASDPPPVALTKAISEPSGDQAGQAPSLREASPPDQQLAEGRPMPGPPSCRAPEPSAFTIHSPKHASTNPPSTTKRIVCPSGDHFGNEAYPPSSNRYAGSSRQRSRVRDGDRSVQRARESLSRRGHEGDRDIPAAARHRPATHRACGFPARLVAVLFFRQAEAPPDRLKARIAAQHGHLRPVHPGGYPPRG